MITLRCIFRLGKNEISTVKPSFANKRARDALSPLPAPTINAVVDICSISLRHLFSFEIEDLLLRSNL
jgi:hypothetical protein